MDIRAVTEVLSLLPPNTISATTAVVSTMIPASMSVSATPTGGPGKGGGDGDSGGGTDPGEVLQQWSSLIGIVTAIVGNVLIAIALNVQRYAHTRLHKERIRVRHRARAAMRRAKGGAQEEQGGGHYGTLDSQGQGDGAESGDTARMPRQGQQDSGDDATQNGETEPLSSSFHTEATSDSQDSDIDDTKVASTYLRSPYWWLGQILITLGEMGNFLAYGFAPASIVSPLGVVALVSNCVIAPVVFHEHFRQRDFWGVVVAVAGVVTVVMSARQEEGKLNPHDVWDAITTLEFEVYLAVTVSLIIILMIASSKYGGRTILIDLGLVGLFGGYTALATKGVSSMLSSTLWRAFTTPVTYVLLVILLGTAIMQIRYVNKALQRFGSTQVIPIQFVLFTLCVIIGSAVLYRDFEKTTTKQALKFVGGCLLTFFGVFLITSGRGPDEEEEEDLMAEALGAEETIGLRPQESHQSLRPQDATSIPVSRSRRSSRFSRVSFADAATPASPAMESTNGVPVLGGTGAEASDSYFATESAPLLGSSWSASHEALATPRGQRTASADSIATESAPASHLPTPLTPGSQHHLRPSLGPARSGSHHGSHGRPGTFINPSPLSSTVTSMVKDAFLRGRDDAFPKKSSLRRIRSTIRAGLFMRNEDDEGQPEDTTDARENLSRTVSAQDEGSGLVSESEIGRRRSRSVSDTLGSFFRPKKKQQQKGSYTENDIETGSGSGENDGPDDDQGGQ